MLLIGSRAAILNGDLDRKPKDWDVIATMEEINNFYTNNASRIKAFYPFANGKKYFCNIDKEIIEFEIAWPDTSAAELQGMLGRRCARTQMHGYYVNVADRDYLYALKMSHRFLKNSPHFLKTMRDIQAFRKLGVKDPTVKREEHDWLPAWYAKRVKETYNYAHPKLNVTKDNFFKDDNIQYVYDHDSIHQAMKHLDEPAYTYFKSDQAEVLCDKGLFFALPLQAQLYAVAEEAYVLALERSQIPHPNVMSPKKAFEFALMKICTSITSGWFRSFAWEHYDQVLAIYKENYLDTFHKAVEAGIVKKL